MLCENLIIMQISSTLINILNALRQQGRLESVIYNPPAKVNVVTDTAASPCGVLYCLTDGTIDLTLGQMRERAEVNVLFITHQSQLDFNGTSNEPLLDAMVEVAKDFIADVLESPAIDIVGNEVVIRCLYDFEDTNTTGVSLQFTAEEVQGQCV